MPVILMIVRSNLQNYVYLNLYLSTGYAVTIIVEGGINTCVAVLNDIQMKRPVIFIQVLAESYK
jgi:hypothetical protein